MVGYADLVASGLSRREVMTQARDEKFGKKMAPWNRFYNFESEAIKHGLSCDERMA
jgi:hypothetical protein